MTSVFWYDSNLRKLPECRISFSGIMVGVLGVSDDWDLGALGALRTLRTLRTLRVFKDLSGCKDNNLFLKCKMRRKYDITKKGTLGEPPLQVEIIPTIYIIMCYAVMPPQQISTRRCRSRCRRGGCLRCTGRGLPWCPCRCGRWAAGSLPDGCTSP